MTEKLERKLIETYEIRKKNSRDMISRWKRDPLIEKGRVQINSLEDVNNYIACFINSEGWELQKEKITKKGTVYTFLSIPHPNSVAAKNPDLYLDNYIHIRIRPKIRLIN